MKLCVGGTIDKIIYGEHVSELERKWPSLDDSHSYQKGQAIHILLPNFKLNQVRNNHLYRLI